MGQSDSLLVQARFSPGDDSDLIFFFREADGELGAKSIQGPMVDMAMSGISEGGNLSQHTEARMDSNSPVAREARVKAILRQIGPRLVRVLSRYYSPEGWPEHRRMAELAPLTDRALEAADGEPADYVADLRLRSCRGPKKQQAQAELAEVGADAERLLATAKHAYAVARKMHQSQQQDHKESHRVRQFRALLAR